MSFLGTRCRRSVIGAISKVVSPVVRVVGQTVRGSPGPVRPLRLLPLRTRRFADQYNRYDSNYSTSESSQDTDESKKVGDQGYNSGNINNQVGDGPATAGDFNNGMAPLTFVSVSTTIHPVPRRPISRRRHSFYEYGDDYYYEDYVEPRPTRPTRRRSHRPRVRPTLTTTTTTTVPTTANPTNQLLKDLIREGLIDPKELFTSELFSSHNQSQIFELETMASRKRRSDIDTETETSDLEEEFFRYAQHVSIRQTAFWDEISPIISKYQIDFSILISIQTDPINGGEISPQTLFAVQTDPLNTMKNRTRRDVDTQVDNDYSKELLKDSPKPFNQSVTEIRNITQIFHKETTRTFSFESTYRISFKTLCLCFIVIMFLVTFCYFRHNRHSQ